MSDSQSNYFVLPALTLWWREMVRFFRQRDRVVGAMATPVVFWLLLGFGLGKSFKAPGAPEGHGYLEYFYAGRVKVRMVQDIEELRAEFHSHAFGDLEVLKQGEV